MTDHSDKSDSIPALNDLRAEFVRVAQAESRPFPSRRRLRRLALALGGLALVAAMVTAGIVLTSDPDPATAPQGSRPGGIAASGPLYASLAELVAKTDLVVVGTVEEVLPPEIIEAEDPQYPTREFNTVVRVDEVLKGSAPASVTVNTLELAFGGPGSAEWRQPGERVLLFLSPSRETDGVHILANTNSSQTAYEIRGEDLVATIRDPLSNRIAALPLPELRGAVREATAAAEGK